MLVIVANVSCQSGQNQAFEAAFKALSSAVASSEPENHRYELCQSVEAPCDYVILEQYTDSAAFKFHLGNPALAEQQAALGGLLAGAPTLAKYDLIVG